MRGIAHSRLLVLSRRCPRQFPSSVIPGCMPCSADSYRRVTFICLRTYVREVTEVTCRRNGQRRCPELDAPGLTPCNSARMLKPNQPVRRYTARAAQDRSWARSISGSGVITAIASCPVPVGSPLKQPHLRSVDDVKGDRLGNSRMHWRATPPRDRLPMRDPKGEGPIGRPTSRGNLSDLADTLIP